MDVETTIGVLTFILGGACGIANARAKMREGKFELHEVQEVEERPEPEMPLTPTELKVMERWFRNEEY